MAGIFGKLFSEEQRELSALEKIADQVLKYEPEMQALSDDELRAKTDEYRKRIVDFYILMGFDLLLVEIES